VVGPLSETLAQVAGFGLGELEFVLVPQPVQLGPQLGRPGLTPTVCGCLLGVGSGLIIRGRGDVEPETGGEQVLDGDQPATFLVQYGSGEFAGLAAADRRTAHTAGCGGLALGQQGTTGAHGPVSSPARMASDRPARVRADALACHGCDEVCQRNRREPTAQGASAPTGAVRYVVAASGGGRSEASWSDTEAARPLAGTPAVVVSHALGVPARGRASLEGLLAQVTSVQALSEVGTSAVRS
jgi:hypothetical protein